jgi:hypothetical protein
MTFRKLDSIAQQDSVSAPENKKAGTWFHPSPAMNIQS